LCRDPAVSARDWRCPSCHEPRDVGAIEARLVAALCHASDAYHLQDLKCLRCGSVAANHLQQQCDVCGGHVRATVASGTARRLLGVYKSVAEYHGMEALGELAGWHLGHS
jgi:DNA polymerase epsilon subunit 1